jgi:LPS sulfotransferase NodH
VRAISDDRHIPKLSYTIWFTQRTGSTWLCEALASTGVAGRPGEYLNHTSPADALRHYDAKDGTELLSRIHALGSTPNGVFGIKQGYTEPRFGSILDMLGGEGASRLARWETAFPNHRHIFMTRRNKLRLAVSWWRAIKTGEWHRRRGQQPSAADIAGDYDLLAIDRLMQEAVVREAGIQELFSEAGIVPVQIAYEDALQDLRATVNTVLRALDLPPTDRSDFGIDLEKTSDALTEAWVQRFRNERQDGWDGRGW